MCVTAGEQEDSGLVPVSLLCVKQNRRAAGTSYKVLRSLMQTHTHTHTPMNLYLHLCI